MSRVKKDSNKIQVTFNKEQIKLIRQHKGIFGEEDAEIVRYIVINWVIEKNNIATGHIGTELKNRKV